MFKIDVKSTVRSYPVYIGKGVLDFLSSFLGDADKVLIVSDRNVERFYGDRFPKPSKGMHVSSFIMKPGESSKSLKTLTAILEKLRAENFTRDSVIVAFGGGVVGDIAGFAASIYMRGIKVIQVPTTLLSSVDSSVGGKTGIDFKGIKNLVGSFYNPSVVLIDPCFLVTLPKEEFISGMGEVVKYKFLIGEDFYNRDFSFIHQLKFGSGERFPFEIEKELASIIRECILFKSSVTEVDERDNGLRKILNLGHTFGHAYESASSYKIKHGIAVALGLISSFYLSHLNGFMDSEKLNTYEDKVREILTKDYSGYINIEDTVAALKLDKKSLRGKTSFVLLKEPGNIMTDFISQDKKVIKSIKSTFSI